jgi:tripartite ATP-independent transporter DctM subunit
VTASLLLVGFSALMLLGVPIALAIGVSAIATMLFGGLGVDTLASLFDSGLSKYQLLAIPMFVFAGAAFDRSGMATRLLTFATAIVGTGRGSLAVVAVLVAVLMGGISGSGAAIAAAVAGIMTSSMVRAGYPRPFIASVVGASASTDILVPPSITLIIYSMMVPAAPLLAMFAAGIIPGTIAGLMLMIPAWLMARHYGFGGNVELARPPFWKSLRGAAWALGAKVVILGGLRYGIFTPTEAGVVAVMYCLFVGFFIHRNMRFKDLGPLTYGAAELTATIMIVLAFADVFGWIINTLNVAGPITQALLVLNLNEYAAIAALVVFLLVVGIFLDGVPILLVVVPLLLPLMAHYQWNPVWFGVIVVLMIAIGQVTPPLAMNLMVAAKIAGTEIEPTVKYTVWMMLGMMLTLLLVIVYPDVALWLPRHLKLL